MSKKANAIKLSEEEDAIIYYEKVLGKNITIQKRAAVIYYASKGINTITEIHKKCGCTRVFVKSTLKGYFEKGILYKDNMNSDKLIDSMRRLVHDSTKKVFLILDNLRVRRSKKVQTWLEKHRDEIEIFYLPPYAPEYNPDELMNSDLKC